MKYKENELALLWIDSFLNLSYYDKQYLYSLIKGKEHIKSVLEGNSIEIIEKVTKEAFDQIINSANREYFASIIGELEEKGITAITAESENYPTSLLETDEPPLVLYAMGNLSLLENDLFGIVGSRKTLPLSVSIAKDYTKTLVEAGLTIVTGIAQGIDKAVIESALGSGKLISVIAGGFDNIYPKSHTQLFNEVVDRGLVISEQPPKVVPQPFNFPRRNRIISALSRGVLIVSGAKKSGTLYTAEYAEIYGKDVFAVPYSIGTASGEGCNELIKKGASLTDTPKDILDFYGLEVKEEKEQLPKEEQIIVNVLKDGALHINLICEKTNKDIVEVTTLISMLVIKGIVVKSGTNVYGLTRKISED